VYIYDMSRYEWESGELKLPAREWAAFKRDLRAAHDGLQEKAYALAESIFAEVLAAGRGRRGFDYHEEAERVFGRKVSPPASRGFYHAASNPNQGLEPYRDSILAALFPKGLLGKMSKPKKAHFPKATNKTTSFGGAGWWISLEDAGRVFRWRVSENNHACETAHEHPLAAAAFRLLDKVKWTRGSGGKIVGNDELNEESSEEGGGANYVTMRYGPLGEADDPVYLLRRRASKSRKGKAA
jgi:hypothetical protein